MGLKWTRSELRGLLQGDRRILEAWVGGQADSLYTWLICEYGLSPSESASLTAAVFSAALEGLDQFRRQDFSMFRWLQSLARDKVAAASPADSRSRMSSEDLAAIRMLVQLAEKPLDENIIERPICGELLRAAIADLDEEDREILLARYHRLSSGADLVVSADQGPEEVQNRLVHARHELRLGIYREARKGCPSIEPLSPAVRMEVFEANLEKLFHSLDPYLSLPEESRTRLIQALGREAARISVGRRHNFLQRRIVSFAAGATAVLILLAVGSALTVQRARRSHVSSVTVTHTPPPQSPQKPQTPDEKTAVAAAQTQEIDRRRMEEELQLVFRYGTEQDIPALLAVLRTGCYSAQFVAAHFLGQYGDASVINPLQEAAEHWYPSEREENPFLKAIDAVEARLKEPPPLPVEEDEAPEEPAIVPVTESAATEPNEPPAVGILPDANSLDHLSASLWTEGDPNEATDERPVESEVQPEETFEEDPNEPYLLETLETLPAGGQLWDSP